MAASKEYTVCGSVMLDLPRSFTVTAESAESAEAQAVELARECGEVLYHTIQVYESEVDPVVDADAEGHIDSFPDPAAPARPPSRSCGS